MSPQAVARLTSEMQELVRSLRSLSRKPEHEISSVSHGLLYEQRIGTMEYAPSGPFNSEADFVDFQIRCFRRSFRSDLQGIPKYDRVWEEACNRLRTSIQKDFPVSFTHGDLAGRNILVDPKSGRLTGLLDWASSGWYPIYWEYFGAVNTAGDEEEKAWVKTWLEPYDEQVDSWQQLGYWPIALRYDEVENM